MSLSTPDEAKHEWPPKGIQWYYADDQAGIYIAHGDCRDIIPRLPTVDLVLTDPPYGIGYISNKPGHVEHSSIHGDDIYFDPRFLLEVESDCTILWGANNYTKFLPFGGWLCWDKRVVPEADAVFGSPFELAWISRASTFKIARIQHGAFINADRANMRREHPTQKPVRLMAWCITLSRTTGTILDPFCGSGTTLRAAKDLGRKCIGIEVEERYCEIASRRLEQEVLNLK